MKPKELVGIWKRLVGCFYGSFAGLVFGVILFFVLRFCGAVDPVDQMLTRFAVYGAGSGAVFGFVFPRLFIGLACILGQVISGIPF